MSDKISALEKKRKQLEELKRKKQKLMDDKKHKQELESPTKPQGNHHENLVYDSPIKTHESPGLDLQANLKSTTVNKIDINDHLNIVKILSREKPICYDQKVEVTVEKLRQWAEMEAQEKAPAYDYEADQIQEEEKEINAEVKKLEEELKVHYLTNEEVMKVMDNNKFKKFMKESYMKFEDVIQDKIPLIEDIMEYECPDLAEDLREKLGEPTILNDESKGAMINTKQYIVSELLYTNAGIVAAYAIREEINTIGEALPKGQVIVWNPENSEIIYHGIAAHKVNRIYCPEETEGKIIWGGLSSGQVVKWDFTDEENTTNKAVFPFLKSMPTLNGNFLPIYGLFGYELQMENFSMYRDSKRIISLSNDGKACIWRENDLSQPDFSVHLKWFQEPHRNSGERDTNEIPLAPMIVKKIDEKLLIGTFDKLLHIYDIKDFFKGNEIIYNSEYYQGHQASVCSLSYLTIKDMPDFPSNGLILTSSFDFEIKIWRQDETNSLQKQGETKPLHNIEFHEDFVSGCSWCSLHPAMFATSDASGNQAIWNLLEDIDYPIYVTKTDHNKTEPIFTIEWQKDSNNILVGTVNGNIKIYPQKKVNLKYTEEQLEEFRELVNNNFE